jgi:hypothetical protein
MQARSLGSGFDKHEGAFANPIVTVIPPPGAIGASLIAPYGFGASDNQKSR